MGRGPDEKFMAQQFAMLEDAAIKGERCPATEPFGSLTRRALALLIRRGMIKSVVYPGPWRQITILAGPNAGKSTAAAPPLKGKERTARPPAEFYRYSSERKEPSRPRALTPEELKRL